MIIQNTFKSSTKIIIILNKIQKAEVVFTSAFYIILRVLLFGLKEFFFKVVVYVVYFDYKNHILSFFYKITIYATLINPIVIFPISLLYS